MFGHGLVRSTFSFPGIRFPKIWTDHARLLGMAYPARRPGLRGPSHQSWNMSFQCWRTRRFHDSVYLSICAESAPPLDLFLNYHPPSPLISSVPTRKLLSAAKRVWSSALESGLIPWTIIQHATLRNIHPHRRRQTPYHRCPPTFDQPYLRNGPGTDLPCAVHRYLLF